MANNFKKIPTRSQAYQDKFAEISYSHELLDIFSNNDSIYRRLNPFSYNDEIAALEEELNKELWRIIENNLNERQKTVVKMTAEGKTQVEIAKVLGVNQSSVVKFLNGNANYQVKDANGRPTTYGGIKQKLRDVAKNDPIINEILKKIADLRENDPF